jgi:dolichyl-phosphate-mannose--protein O-mannosyl transferase
MTNRSDRILGWLDPIALYGVQPLVAAFSVFSLLADRAEVHAVAKPFLTWISIILLQLIFAEDIWSFAVRQGERRRLGMVWVKLVGAGVCGILAFAAAYRQIGLIDQGQISHTASTALYFSVTAWSTVGYGDVVPTVAARPFAAAQSMIGVVYDSAFIGLILYASTRNNNVNTPGDTAKDDTIQ